MKYVCSVCGYVYDEEKEDKLFSDLPDTWVLPVVQGAQSAFQTEGRACRGKTECRARG